MRLFQIIFLTVALTTTSLTFAAPADAAGSYIVVDAVDCNPDPETQTFWPLATVRRGGGLPDDNRTTTVMYLYDGATMIESLSAGKVNPDGVTATSGVVNVPTGDSVVVAPWGGRFGDDEPAGVTPLDPGAEYELRVRVYDFDAGEYTWEEATCSFEPRECDGVTSAEMKGPRPGYIGSGEMSTFPNSSSSVTGTGYLARRAASYHKDWRFKARLPGSPATSLTRRMTRRALAWCRRCRWTAVSRWPGRSA